MSGYVIREVREITINVNLHLTNLNIRKTGTLLLNPEFIALTVSTYGGDVGISLTLRNRRSPKI